LTRGINDLLADLAEAADAAAELVMLGKERWDGERPLRLAGEAVIGRLGDIAAKLPDEVTEATPEIPWRERSRACGSSLLTPTIASTTSKSGSLARRRACDGRGDPALASGPSLTCPARPGS
jgi:hypothetical protein